MTSAPPPPPAPVPADAEAGQAFAYREVSLCVLLPAFALQGRTPGERGETGLWAWKRRARAKAAVARVHKKRNASVFSFFIIFFSPPPPSPPFHQKQVHPPTNVTAALALHWTRAGRAAHRAPATPGGPPPPPAPFPPDVAVIAGSTLTLLTLRVPGDAPGDGGLRGPAWPGGSDLDGARLEVTAVVPLAGVPTGAAVLRGRSGPAGAHDALAAASTTSPTPLPPTRDALVLAFRDAKAVVLDWDPVAQRPVPTSLHSFEGGGSDTTAAAAAAEPAALPPAVAADPTGGRAVWPRPPRAAADPDGRLAAVLYYASAVALLPAVDADALDALLVGGGGGGGQDARGASSRGGPPAVASLSPLSARPTSVGNAAVLDLATLPGLGIVSVLDIAFAHRAASPTLLVLHAAAATWPGIARGAAGAGGGGGGPGAGAPPPGSGGPDGCEVVALALDPGGRAPPTPLWRARGLPSDARALSPAPGGGVLVLCHRLLVWVPPGGGGAVGPGPAAALSPRALPGPPPPRLELDPLRELPSLTAARHAGRWGHVLHPDAAPALAAAAAPPPPGLDADADGAAAAWLSPAVAVLALASGQVLSLTAVSASPGGPVSRLEVAPAGVASPASPGGLAPAGPGLLFLGAWGGDSLLLRADVVGGGGGAEATSGGRRGRLGRGATATAAPLLTAAPASDAGVKGEAEPMEADDGAAGALVVVVKAEEGGGDGGGGGGSGGGGGKGGGGGAAAGAPPPAVSLRVVDTLPGLGPIRALVSAPADAAVLGGASAAAAAAAAGAGAPGFLAAAVGVGRAGSLALLRRAVVPEVITAVPLPGLAGAWTLCLSEEDEGGGAWPTTHAHPPPGAGPGAPLGYHTVMLLTVGPATRALRTGSGLDEIPAPASPGGGWETGAPTLAAGTLGGGRFGVQVTPRAVVLMGCGARGRVGTVARPAGILSGCVLGAALAEECAMPPDPAAAASLTAGGAVGLRTHGGGAEVFALDPLAGALVPLSIPGLSADAASGGGGSPVTALALFRDTRHWFTKGGGKAAARHATAAGPPPGPALAAAARADGRLDLFRLDDGAHVATYTGLTDGAAWLSSGVLGAPLDPAAGPSPSPPVTDLLVEAFPSPSGDAGGVAHEAPLLFAACADGGLLVYRASPPPTDGEDDSALPGLARLDVPGLTVAGAPVWPPPGAPGGPAWSASARDPARPSPARLTRFDALGEAPPRHSGVFVAGDKPAWVIAARGSVVAHPAWPGGGGAPPVLGFAPFHNANCGFGFVLAAGPPTEPPQAAGGPAAVAAAAAAAQGVLRVCAMPAATRLDGPWPAARLALKAEPTALAWHGPGRLWAVATCRARVPGATAGLADPGKPPQDPGGDPAAAYAYVASGGPHGPPGEAGSTPGVTAASAAGAAAALPSPPVPGAPPPRPPPPPLDEVRLLSAEGLDTLWRAPLAPGEAATALASVSLRDGGPLPPPRPGMPQAPPPGGTGALVELVAVGTALTGCGEDFPATGRVLLVEVRRAGEVPAGGVEGAALGCRRGRALLRAGGGTVPPAAQWEAEIIYSREFRGPVTTLSAMDGALIVAYGSRVEALGWAGGRLRRAAFHDSPWFVSAALVVKNFVVASDALAGLRFLHAISGVKNFIELAKEWDAQAGVTVGTAVCGRKLCLVSTDAGGAVRAAAYDASHPDSWRGKRLVPLGALHMGCVGTASLAGGVRARTGAPARRGGAPPPPRVQAALVGRADGGLASLLPLSDLASTSLLTALEAAAWTGLPHAAGLNPAAWRARHVSRTPAALGGGARWGGGRPPPGRGILDGDLLVRAALAPRPVLARLAAGLEGGAAAVGAAVGAAVAAVDLAL